MNWDLSWDKRLYFQLKKSFQGTSLIDQRVFFTLFPKITNQLHQIVSRQKGDFSRLDWIRQKVRGTPLSETW